MLYYLAVPAMSAAQITDISAVSFVYGFVWARADGMCPHHPTALVATL